MPLFSWAAAGCAHLAGFISITASAPPGRSRRKASLKIALLAAWGSSWHTYGEGRVEAGEDGWVVGGRVALVAGSTGKQDSIVQAFSSAAHAQLGAGAQRSPA